MKKQLKVKGKKWDILVNSIKYSKRTWIKILEKPILKSPIAIAASQGLRSVGRLTLDYLIDYFNPKLIAEIYSYYFPLIHGNKPSYIPDPNLVGEAGIFLFEEEIEIPCIKNYLIDSHEIILTYGYQADFKGQYEIAEAVLEFYKEIGIKKIIVLAGYTGGEENVCCAANNPNILKEMEKYGLKPFYKGPFYGFSGILLGLSKFYNIEGLCLFGRTKPSIEDPEEPDIEASKNVLYKLSEILNLKMDFSNLE